MKRRTETFSVTLNREDSFALDDAASHGIMHWQNMADGTDDYGYPYGYSQQLAQPRYYGSDPPGYYPEVSQCAAGWQPVPGG